MEQTAEFLLAYQKVGSDGYLHAVANAHETQWAVQDPTTDLAADQALFPAVVSAATLLNTDSSLVAQLKTAEGEIEPYARTDAATHAPAAEPAADLGRRGRERRRRGHRRDRRLLPAVGDAAQRREHRPGAGLAVRRDRRQHHRERRQPDRAGRPHLQLAAQREQPPTGASTRSTPPGWTWPARSPSDLVAITENYQAYISGLANLSSGTTGDEPYIEQSSNVATALDEALATDYDGTLRIAPAWPSGWDAAGTVYIQGGSKVDVQVEGGVIATAAIQAGTTETMTVRNPWPGQQAEVVNGSTGAVVVAADHQRHVQRPGDGRLLLPDRAAVLAHHLAAVRPGHRHPGDRRQAPGQRPDRPRPGRRLPEPGRLLQQRRHHRRQQHRARQLRRQRRELLRDRADQRRRGPGATVTSQGLSYTFPNVAAGTNDNTVAEGQTITMSGSGTLGFLVSASYGPASGTGTITYTDGSTQSYTLTLTGLVLHDAAERRGAWPSAPPTRTGRATPRTPQAATSSPRPSRSPRARPSPRSPCRPAGR